VTPVSKQLNQEKLYQLRDAIWRSAALAWQSGILPYLPVDLELENENHNQRSSKDFILDPYLAQYLEGKIIASKPKLKEFVNTKSYSYKQDRDKYICCYVTSWLAQSSVQKLSSGLGA